MFNVFCLFKMLSDWIDIRNTGFERENIEKTYEDCKDWIKITTHNCNIGQKGMQTIYHFFKCVIRNA